MSDTKKKKHVCFASLSVFEIRINIKDIYQSAFLIILIRRSKERSSSYRFHSHTKMLLSILLFVVFSSSTILGQSGIYYQCDFEQPCEDLRFDSDWIVNNVSSHPDHTYGNLSGHYITYIGESTTEPVAVVRTRDWVDTPWNASTCFSYWVYLAPGDIAFVIELAQGDDLQARLPDGGIGINMNESQWVGGSIVLPYTHRSIPFILFTNITGIVDMDDVQILDCVSSGPVPPVVTIFECDFDQNLCPDLISLSNYSYHWSSIQAEEAQNYTATAPKVDYSVGKETGT